MKKSLSLAVSAFLFAGAAWSGEIVPPNCTVEDWCLKKATDCFVGYVTSRGGFYQAHAQYSVVRKVTAICNIPYGGRERRVIMGPVEPIEFSSADQDTETRARDQVLYLCERYREDWVSAAPVCE